MTQIEQAGSMATHRDNAPRWVVRAALVLIMAGCALRLRAFLDCRSLWIDEAALSLNVCGRSFAQLALPLDHNQSAPFGFLILTKLATRIFGNTEYALRSVPLVAGIASVMLFYIVAIRLVSRLAALFALLVFCLCEPLVFYSATVKPYSVDVLFCVMMLNFGVTLLRPASPLRNVFALLVVGTVGVWLSYPVLFLFPAVAITSFIYRVARGEYRWATWMIAAVGVWLVNLSVDYHFFLRYSAAHGALNEFWKFGFPPHGPAIVQWIIGTYFSWFSEPAGLHQPAISAGMALVGVATLRRSNTVGLILLVSPLMVALAAALIHTYPFASRLILYTIPIGAILIGVGVAATCTSLAHASRLASVALASLFAYPFCIGAVHQLAAPKKLQELRPVLARITPSVRPGDRFYVKYGSNLAFEWYSRQARDRVLSGVEFLVGSLGEGNWGAYEADTERLRGQGGRVWFIASHYSEARDAQDERFLLFLFDSSYRRMEEHHAVGASAYLFDVFLAPADKGVAPAIDPVCPGS